MKVPQGSFDFHRAGVSVPVAKDSEGALLGGEPGADEEGECRACLVAPPGSRADSKESAPAPGHLGGEARVGAVKREFFTLGRGIDDGAQVGDQNRPIEERTSGGGFPCHPFRVLIDTAE